MTAEQHTNIAHSDNAVDDVLDVIETALINKYQEWQGVPPSGEMVAEISKAVRKDLASLGIRLTYDTAIGVGK